MKVPWDVTRVAAYGWSDSLCVAMVLLFCFSAEFFSLSHETLVSAAEGNFSTIGDTKKGGAKQFLLPNTDLHHLP